MADCLVDFREHVVGLAGEQVFPFLACWSARRLTRSLRPARGSWPAWPVLYPIAVNPIASAQAVKDSRRGLPHQVAVVDAVYANVHEDFADVVEEGGDEHVCRNSERRMVSRSECVFAGGRCCRQLPAPSSQLPGYATVVRLLRCGGSLRWRQQQNEHISAVRQITP